VTDEVRQLLTLEEITKYSAGNSYKVDRLQKKLNIVSDKIPNFYNNKLKQKSNLLHWHAAPLCGISACCGYHWYPLFPNFINVQN